MIWPGKGQHRLRESNLRELAIVSLLYNNIDDFDQSIMSIKEILRSEQAILAEARELIGRDRDKYFSRVVGLYLISLTTPDNCELATIARATYFSLRIIDDVLDLDRSITDDIDPVNFCRNLQEQILNRQGVTHSKLGILLDYSIKKLEQRARPGDDVRQDYWQSIENMIFDNQRISSRVVLTSETLENYLNTSFVPMVNIMLIGLGSRWRAQDIPDFPSVQARLYTIRDFEEDWSKGIINVPIETLQQAGLNSSSSFNQVRHSSVVKQWLNEQRLYGQSQLRALNIWLKNDCGERLTRIMIRSQLKKLEKI